MMCCCYIHGITTENKMDLPRSCSIDCEEMLLVDLIRMVNQEANAQSFCDDGKVLFFDHMSII